MSFSSMNRPTRLEAEQRIIGILFDCRDEAVEVFARIKDPRYFQNSHYRSIFSAAKRLHDRGEPIDETLIRHEIEKKDGKTASWVQTTMVEASGHAKNFPNYIPYFAKIIFEDYHLKRIRGQFPGVDTFEDVIALGQSIQDCTNEIQYDDEPEWSGVVERMIDKQHAIREGRVEAGYSFGLRSLDRHIRLQPGKLYATGGLQKCGKSLFLISILCHHLASDPPVPCLLFSMEMSAELVAQKLFSRRARVDSRVLDTKYLSNGLLESVQRQQGTIRGFPLTVNEAPDIGVTEILNQARRWKLRNQIPDGVGIVAVDFIQLVRQAKGKYQSEATALKEIAYALARLAKELHVVVIALAQLNRNAEGEVPQIGFLEGSSGIAQASEAVILLNLHSRTYSDVNSYDIGADKERIDIHIAVQRTGESRIKIKCLADLSTGHFYDMINAVPSERATMEGLGDV